MKRFLFILSIVFLTFTTISCGDSENTEDNADSGASDSEFTGDIDSGDTVDTAPDKGNTTDDEDSADSGDDSDAFDGLPKARVRVVLTWKQGLDSASDLGDTKGSMIDLDLRLIKKSSLEADPGSYGTIGYMCSEAEIDNSCKRDNCKKHDDCSEADDGFADTNKKTVSWNATHILDNRWGGGNYKNPEAINLLDEDCYKNAGSCDLSQNDDDYLIVVTYFECLDQEQGGACDKGGASYLVDAEIKIYVDDELVPRDGTRASDKATDSVQTTSLKFQITPHQWKFIAEINWDGTASPRDGKSYPGDAVVTDTLASTFPLCTWESYHCFTSLVPVWGTPTESDAVKAYKNFVESPAPGDEDNIGICE